MADQKKELSTSGTVATGVGLFALIGFVVWLAVLDARDSAANSCGSDTGAWVMAQEAVKTRLKAPSTAEFPWFSEDYVSTDGECGYVVAAHVDAQNGFGAQIRSRFVVALEHVPESGGYRIGEVAIK